MKAYLLLSALAVHVVCLSFSTASAQVTNSLPGRTIVKLLPDYVHPRVLALNSGNGSLPGTVLAINPTNGTVLNEISVDLNPTDMATSPAGDVLYVINAGSRTISKIDLTSFSVVSKRSITTPTTYDPSNPLHLVANQSGTVYFTDGAWGPEIYSLNYATGASTLILDTGGNEYSGAGGMVLNRSGDRLYIWQQYGWGAGYAYSAIVSYSVTNNSLQTIATGPTLYRDPLDSPILMDAAERWVFNKTQKVSATNVTVLLTQFTNTIYAISLDGSIAFGPTEVFNAQNGLFVTNLPFSTSVQALSGDQKKLFRYNSATSALVVYDMASIFPVTGLTMLPTPADGSVVAVAPTNLVWTAYPTALAYDVYFGTNQAAVGAATPSSSLYLGRVNTPGMRPAQALTPGTTYYWRVDGIGFQTTNAGPTWSFTVSKLTLAPQQVSANTIAAYNPAKASVSLSGVGPTAWTAAVTGGSWLTVDSTSGTTPATLTLSFDTRTFPAGTYTNNVEFTVEGVKVELPVTVTIDPLNIIKMAADLQRPYIYALQPPALSGQTGRLLFINTATGSIDKTLPIGSNPVDLTINYGEGRLYVASWTEDATYVVDLQKQQPLPSLHLGTDVYKINAGAPGRIMVEGEDQWVGFYVYDTGSGASVVSLPWHFREGDGETDPSGVYYYHCDNDISDAHIHKIKIQDSTISEVAASNQHPYGSRNLIMCADGTRLFWGGYIYDANLNELGYLGEEIYATTAHGDVALGAQHAFNVHNGQILYTWPFQASVAAVSGDQQKVFLCGSQTNPITVIPMSAIASVPGPGLNPTPADGAVIDLPLTQFAWTLSPFALSYRVYLGTNAAAVAAATPDSPLYVGTSSSNSLPLSASLNPGSTYYWRVDLVGVTGVTSGAVWSFTALPLVVAPQTLSLNGVTGLPILPQTLALTAASSKSWSITVAQPWMTASVTNGTGAGSATLSFNTTNLTAGIYTNQLTFTIDGVSMQMPVALRLFDLNASKMVADPNRNYVYVLHPGSGNASDAFLLFLNTDSGVVEKVMGIGINPTDMAVNRFEDRLYISNWKHNQTHVVDLKAQNELPSLMLGTDVYKISGGLAGRIVVEGEDQWISVNILDTSSGTVVGSLPWPEWQGDGQTDPSGRFYYHSDMSNIRKFQIDNGVVELAGSDGHASGLRNLVLSADGGRLFSSGYVFDANLADLGSLGTEIYACSTNGSIAFGSQKAFDTATRLAIYTLPATSSVQVVDRNDLRLWYFDSGTRRLGSVPMSATRMPSITQQPASNTLAGVGANVNLTVTGIGFGTLSYQWILCGTNLSGQTNYFLSLNNIQEVQGGDYQVVVNNSYGAVTSSVARVIVQRAPKIDQQFLGTNVSAGQSFSLSVAASGSEPLRYLWLFENGFISGATNATLVISNAQAVNEGIYRAVVLNAIGTATSSAALVRVTPAAPGIIAGPDSLSVPAGSNVVFGAVISGSQPISCQWLLNGTVIASTSSARLVIANAQAWNAGNYRLVVSNSFGSVTSSIATLSVTPSAPSFVGQPTGGTFQAGQNVTLSGLARGSEPMGYYWQHDGVGIAGAYQTSLSLTNLKVADGGSYTLVAFNALGASTSLVASVTVTTAPPVFVQQPGSANVYSGSQVTFNSLASGSNPLRYQWYFKDGLLQGQTNAQLTYTYVTASNAGNYYVIATNPFGSATSTVAQLTVRSTPVLQQGLTNVVTMAGSNLTLAVSAIADNQTTYSWQFNGATLAGNGPSLSLTNVRPTQSGFYRVTLSNPYGSVSSTSRVSVLSLPGAVAAWGDNSGGQTDVPENLDNVVAVAGGDYHSLALRADGSLAAWGYNGDGQTFVPTNALRFVAIAAGAAHNLAILEDGSLLAWGRNDSNQTIVPVGASKNVVAVSAGDSHSLALLGSGAVVAWGDNSYGQTTVPYGLNGVCAVAAGRQHSLALRNNGTVIGWGFNAYGQATPPAGLANAIAITAGYLHSAALCADGRVVAWGDNTYGQTNVPANLTNVIAIAAGDFYTLALCGDGKVVGWGDNQYKELALPGSLTNALVVAAGNYHGLAISPAQFVVQAQRHSAGVLLQWRGSGVLQWAPTPCGPFVDVPAQSNNRYTNSDFAAPAKFFRLRK